MAATTNNGTPRDVRAAVTEYRRIGVHTLRLKPLSKEPVGKWKNAAPIEAANFEQNENVAAVLGTKSQGLIDVDLDWPEAAQVADEVLAHLPSFGRASAPRSHRVATCPQPRRRVVFDLNKKEAEALGLDSDDDRCMVAELRGDGCYTMLPPSIHPSGELVTHQGPAITPPDLPWSDLERLLGLVAFLAVVVRRYPRVRGDRDNICLALTGALMSAGRDEEDTNALVSLVARLASDEEFATRGNKAHATREKIRSGKGWWGLPELCAKLGMEPLREKLRGWLGGSAEGGDAIVVVDGRLVQIVDKAEQRLIDTSADVYQRGSSLTRTARLESDTNASGVQRVKGSVVLVEVNAHWLTEKFAQSARWLRPKDEKLVPTDPPTKYAAHYIARVGAWRVRSLLAVVNTPTLRADGSVLQTPGYDEASRLLYDPLGVEFPRVPENPTRDEADAALQTIEALFAHFPFVDEAARSVVLAAVLTSLVRRSIATAPLFAIDAPTAGSGKSLIAETIGVLATGHTPAMLSQGKSAEEDEKRLSTVLMTGDPLIVLDNCDLPVEGDFLCSMLTQELVQARILGRSERALLPSSAMVIATGNNLTLAGDVSRRAVLCRLDAGVERPDTRQFAFDPRQVASERRAEFVVAALTVLRAYIGAGTPNPLPRVGSFEQWNLVREPLVWLGRADPADTRTRVLANDPRKAELAELLAAWRACFGDEEKTLAQVRALCEQRAYDERSGSYGPADEERDLLLHLLTDLSGRPTFNAKSIGRHLKRHVDRVVAGLVMRCRDNKRDGMVWSVRETASQQRLGLEQPR